MVHDHYSIKKKTNRNISENYSRLRLDIPGGVSGWYLLEGKLLGPAGDSVRLRLHFGNEGDASGSSLPVASVSLFGLRLSSVLMLENPSPQAWLMAEEGVVPSFSSLSLRKIKRSEALLRMLVDLPESRGGVKWASVVRASLGLGLTAMRDGAGRAGRILARRYFEGLRSDTTPLAAKAKINLGLFNPSQAFDLLALDQLRLVSTKNDTPPIWEAVGDDPKFRLNLDLLEVVLPGGWYRLRIHMEACAGFVVAPCLYPDYGNGYAHEEMIRLPSPNADGCIEVLILLKNNASGLRFDPTTRRACFTLSRFELKRMGRFEALLYMLLGFNDADGNIDWLVTIRALRDFLIGTLHYGVSIATNDLFFSQPYSPQPAENSYAEWVRKYDTLGNIGSSFHSRVMQATSGPLISLLLPVYQTPEPWLRRCIDSVLGQVYGNWELCIADDASPSMHIQCVLHEYEQRDPRIRVVYRQDNGHIAEASNSALALAHGEYVGLLDHDDELRPHALLEMAEAVIASPSLEFLYSDEDKIDEDGRRFDPYFKPDWNPDLLLSQNYICHFTVIRTSLVRSVGGFRKGFEGSQDHDLILRCTERLSAGRIHHIPKVLYHWRAIAGSTALEHGAKDYAAAAGSRAVAEHLQRTGVLAKVEQMPHGHYRIHWPLPLQMPKVSVVIPTRDRLDLLRKCVESIFSRTSYENFECLVVDNQSTDPEALGYLDELRSRKNVRVLSYDMPFNYSAINNWAVSQCDGEVLCLLNNDIEVISEDWLGEMVAHAIRPDIGAVGAMLYYPDGSIQHAGVILGVGGVANHAYIHEPSGYAGHGARGLVVQNLSAVTGACMVLRRALYEYVGGFDERLQVAFNDIDLCLRLCEAGYRNLWTPFAELYHHESATRGSDDSSEKRLRFVSEVQHMQERWGEWLQNDPAYNPNLSLDDCKSSLSFPPRL